MIRFAGAAAAIEAKDRGLDVLLVEKMDMPGGISVTAGGGFRIARDKAAAFKYLQATNAGNTPDDVLQALYYGNALRIIPNMPTAGFPG